MTTPTPYQPMPGRRLLPALACLLTLGLPRPAPAQDFDQPARRPAPGSAARTQTGPLITPNFTDADLGRVIDAVAMATHKTFITDPRVRAQVTMRSSTPLTPDELYQAFLSILQVHNAIAVPGAGGTIKIIPDANQRYYPGDDLPDHVSSTSDEIVTQVIEVKNVSASQLLPALRPLVPNSGQINAFTESNMLIISDRAANVARIMKIIARLDQSSNSDVEVVPLQNASAAEVVRVLSVLYQGQGMQEPGMAPLKMVADDRSNTILISGDAAARLRAKALIAHLDTPQAGGGDTFVRYLRYADSEKLAPKLKDQITAMAQAAGGATGGTAAGNAAAQELKSAQIWSDPQNNALVITAPPKLMREVNAIIDKLDIRRAEVLVEAIVVDVDLSKSSELGVNWATWGENNGQVIPGATFLTPVGGASLVDLYNAISNPADINSALESGTTVAVGRVAQTGLSFAAMLRALRSDTDTNIVATPSALTMDHQEATIKVVDEVPFVTGQYTSGSTVTNGTVTPFQTIQQIEVGTILKLTPQINEGDAIVLKIDIESSSVIATPSGATGITTSKREITTNVLIEDGGIIVLGGLISNEYDHTNTQVPLLGSIPIIGELFKDHSATLTKTNMMIFLRPQILRDGTQTAIETDSKYNFIRQEQQDLINGQPKGTLPLLPGIKPPELPKLPPPPAAGSTPEAPVTEAEKRRAAAANAAAGGTATAAAAAPAPPAPASAPAKAAASGAATPAPQ
ncbi:MAG TPA: type II secretion system secretin GspD [Steroidobacteraceae bacterium]|nr:type II secretion system secretin GspD [Steroidobacteraceae bacterium]